ncbi:MAG: double-strand break repair helicase AddA [Xanthobacteraceae bacterium]
MSALVIPAELRDAQHQASNPESSAWVSANAGAGKTHVLAQRVIRLLLTGVEPSKILCLTFTKAAAANMANRVFETLRGWTALDDRALDAKIVETGAKPGGARQRARARRLFAAALDTPGGLKVQTIHGFCAGLLQQFPFEANVAARFRVMEDVQQQQLLNDIRLAVLLDASNAPDGPLGRALATAVASATDFAFNTALNEAISEREKYATWRDHVGGVAALHAEISAALGIRPDETIEQIENEFFSASLSPESRWPGLIEILNQGSKTDRERAACFSQALVAQGRVKIENYLANFFTQDGSPRKSVVTGAITKAYPAVAEQFANEQVRLIALTDRRRAIATRDRSVALLTIADAVLTRYDAEKERRGLLDYEDIIARTRDMLDRVESAWVHFKLDLGIDHVLIDEAQDTSPAQWDIIARLVAEFTSGAGARGTITRSIFAVGDDKQSIFSFQGAAPDTFDAMRREFERRYMAAELPFMPFEFKYSFRSVPLVLTAVDTVFQLPLAYKGLSADQVPPVHAAVRASAPGTVELWPLVKPDGNTEPEPWDAPFDTATPSSPRVTLARRIATAIGAWMARREMVGDGPERHPVRPGDILILVRQRGSLFEAIIRALKNAGIPVAGADRLVLTEHIAVMDLLALADAVLLPEDDLSLATVLKSPLFGLSEDELFDLAHTRKGTLREALRQKHPDVARNLDQIAAQAFQQTPFAWFADILSTGLLKTGGARKAFLARLGAEANDALDEFLNLALDYERREVPSLQGFVAWLRSASAEIKRDMEMVRDEVRVMTVHGAKGLEAPVVILTDTTSPPAGPTLFQPRLFSLPAQNAPPGTPDRLVWVPNKDSHTVVTDVARQAERNASENEYRRLLYVAMTRAADRLIVCGDVGVKAMPGGCWYDLVKQGLSASGDLSEHDADYGDDKILRFRKAADIEVAGAAAASKPIERESLPGWLRTSVPAEPRRYALTPSSSGDAVVMPAAGNSATRRIAMQRGILAHRLLQSLPDVARERRCALAEIYMQKAGAELPAAERARLLAQVFALMEDTRFAQLFSPESRGEVPIIGHVVAKDGQARAVTGQVDRLTVTENTVWIADYKTNRPPPSEPPKAYVRQLALYRAVLAKIYPNHTIRCALFWTEVPDLMELPAALLDQAYDAIISL